MFQRRYASFAAITPPRTNGTRAFRKRELEENFAQFRDCSISWTLTSRPASVTNNRRRQLEKEHAKHERLTSQTKSRKLESRWKHLYTCFERPRANFFANMHAHGIYLQFKRYWQPLSYTRRCYVYVHYSVNKRSNHGIVRSLEFLFYISSVLYVTYKI